MKTIEQYDTNPFENSIGRPCQITEAAARDALPNEVPGRLARRGTIVAVAGKERVTVQWNGAAEETWHVSRITTP